MKGRFNHQRVKLNSREMIDIGLTLTEDPSGKEGWVRRGHMIWEDSNAPSAEGRRWSADSEGSSEKVLAERVTLCLRIPAGAGTLFPTHPQLQDCDWGIHSN